MYNILYTHAKRENEYYVYDCQIVHELHMITLQNCSLEMKQYS